MTEIWFYHLEEGRAQDLLPDLLRRTLERGLTSSVHTPDADQLQRLSGHLWAHEDVAFLPHGCDGDGNAARQPIWLTAGAEAPNGAAYRFYVDGVMPDLASDARAAQRLLVVFSAADTAATAAARVLWKEARAAGHPVSYWQREPASGGWVNRASA
jgi:DNA polymerase-3 subunit chi